VGALVWLITPFPPWAATYFYAASIVPGNIIWYAILPDFLLGMWYAAKKKFSLTMLPIMLIITLDLVNGALYLGQSHRYRVQVIPIMLIFASVGLLQFKGKAEAFKLGYFLAFLGVNVLYIALKYVLAA
jgi:hypothetical protein